jgi:hypothetical protein
MEETPVSTRLTLAGMAWHTPRDAAILRLSFRPLVSVAAAAFVFFVGFVVNGSSIPCLRSIAAW